MGRLLLRDVHDPKTLLDQGFLSQRRHPLLSSVDYLLLSTFGVTAFSSLGCYAKPPSATGEAEGPPNEELSPCSGAGERRHGSQEAKAVRTRWMSLLVVLLLFPATAWGELTVVSTSPANGATSVDPGLVQVRIRFSAAVRTDGYSICRTEEGTPLPVSKLSFEEGGRVCVLAVALQPGTKCAFSVNDEEYQGFRGAGGRGRGLWRDIVWRNHSHPATNPGASSGGGECL
jgi:hypothetical protein